MNKGARVKNARLFVISAPSGCGKTTLAKRLLEDKSLGLVHSVSATTRKPRVGEKNGRDYHFLALHDFLHKIKERGFLEYEENFGNWYGTPRRFIKQNLAAGRSVLLNIDVKGAMKVRKAYPKKSVLIFIMPPTIAMLKKRLTMRMSDSPCDIKRRLNIAKREIAYKDKYDYTIVNDELDVAHRELRKIIVAESGG